MHIKFWEERSKRRLEDNIKMDLKEVRFDDVNWFEFALDKVQMRAL